MSITPAVELDAIVDDITAILVEVIGDEFLLDVEVTMATIKAYYVLVNQVIDHIADLCVP